MALQTNDSAGSGAGGYKPNLPYWGSDGVEGLGMRQAKAQDAENDRRRDARSKTDSNWDTILELLTGRRTWDREQQLAEERQQAEHRQQAQMDAIPPAAPWDPYGGDDEARFLGEAAAAYRAKKQGRDLERERFIQNYFSPYQDDSGLPPSLIPNRYPGPQAPPTPESRMGANDGWVRSLQDQPAAKWAQYARSQVANQGAGR